MYTWLFHNPQLHAFHALYSCLRATFLAAVTADRDHTCFGNNVSLPITKAKKPRMLRRYCILRMRVLCDFIRNYNVVILTYY